MLGQRVVRRVKLHIGRGYQVKMEEVNLGFGVGPRSFEDDKGSDFYGPFITRAAASGLGVLHGIRFDGRKYPFVIPVRAFANNVLQHALTCQHVGSSGVSPHLLC